MCVCVCVCEIGILTQEETSFKTFSLFSSSGDHLYQRRDTISAILVKDNERNSSEKFGRS